MTGFIAAKGTAPVGVDSLSKKRKSDDNGTEQVRKKFKASEDNNNESDGPQGFIWDGQNYSCAYDSVMTILLSVWSQDPTQWKRQFKDMNRTMNALASGFYQAKEGQRTLETARNKVRCLLHQRDPELFPYGHTGTPVSEMAEKLLRSDNIIASTWIRCVNCGHENNLNKDLQTCVIQCHRQDPATTSACLQKRFQEPYHDRSCAHCDGELNKIMRFDIIPKILVFSVSQHSIQVSKKISFHDGDTLVVFGLKGIVYYGDFHYTARVCTGGSVWFNDGMVSGRKSTYEKRLTEFTGSDLSSCNGKSASLVFYSQN
jgi:hypothetical protein